MQIKKLLYRNIEEALVELNARDKGRYFLCTCPECQQHEAFLYKNNLSFIQCNRENQCGERMVLHFQEKEKDEISFQKEVIFSHLSKLQSRELSQITGLLKYMQKYAESSALDHGYRGLSRKTLRPFIADLRDAATVKKMFEDAKSLFQKNYAESEWICKRNLIFPIYGEDGKVDRILLRSSIFPDIEPKEIQLIVNPSKETRDFFIDMPRGTDVVVISEAILDAASFREIDSTVGIIALTGAAKTNKLCQSILEKKINIQNKKVILALDNDEAGRKASEEIMKTLDEMKTKYEIFPFPDDIKDANEFLNQDKNQFKNTFKRVISTFKERQYVSTKSQRKYTNQMER